jgi:hypothetical protein
LAEDRAEVPRAQKFRSQRLAWRPPAPVPRNALCVIVLTGLGVCRVLLISFRGVGGLGTEAAHLAALRARRLLGLGDDDYFGR